MGPLKVTLCTGVVLAATALVPAAQAADGGGKGTVSVTPSTPSAGADISLRVSGCAGKTAVAVSEAFVADARLVGSDGTLTGETRVRSSIRAGAYAVQITCADFRVKGSIKVVAKPTEPSPRPSALSTPPATPVAPVHAGGGGAAHHLAGVDEARIESPGTLHTVIGLVLAGAAATAVALRSVRRSRRKA